MTATHELPKEVQNSIYPTPGWGLDVATEMRRGFKTDNQIRAVIADMAGRQDIDPLWEYGFRTIDYGIKMLPGLRGWNNIWEFLAEIPKKGFSDSELLDAYKSWAYLVEASPAASFECPLPVDIEAARQVLISDDEDDLESDVPVIILFGIFARRQKASPSVLDYVKTALQYERAAGGRFDG